MAERRPANEERRPTAKRRKLPLKQRIAIAIVRAVEGREGQTTQTTRQQPQNDRPPQRQPQNGRPAPQRAQNGRPAAQRPQADRAVQQRKAYRARMRRRRRAVRIALGVLLTGILFLILARTVLFKIQNIEIVNPEDANYTSEQIVAQCGIAYGTQNLFSCDLEKVEKNIEQRLPYIGKAEVERDFPTSLRVRVEPTKAAAAMAYGTGYLLIDADGKMLENTDTAPDDVPVLRCNTEFELNLGQYIGSAVAGKKPDEKTQAAAATIALFQRISAAAQNAGVNEITLIDIRNEHGITLMYQNRLTLHLGSEDMLEAKLNSAAKTIAVENDGSKTRTGAIDLTYLPQINSRDTYEPASGVSEPASEENTEENVSEPDKKEKNS